MKKLLVGILLAGTLAFPFRSHAITNEEQLQALITQLMQLIDQLKEAQDRTAALEERVANQDQRIEELTPVPQQGDEQAEYLEFQRQEQAELLRRKILRNSTPVDSTPPVSE